MDGWNCMGWISMAWHGWWHGMEWRDVDWPGLASRGMNGMAWTWHEHGHGMNNDMAWTMTWHEQGHGMNKDMAWTRTWHEHGHGMNMDMAWHGMNGMEWHLSLPLLKADSEIIHCSSCLVALPPSSYHCLRTSTLHWISWLPSHIIPLLRQQVTLCCMALPDRAHPTVENVTWH